MKSSRLLPIIIILCLTGLGVFVGINTIINAKNKRPPISPKPNEVVEVSPAAVTEETQSGTVAVLRGIDRVNNKIGVYLAGEMRETSYSYDLATSVKSKNDRELVMPELPLGSIINIEVNEDTGMLSKVAVNKEAWDYQGVKNLQIDEVLSKMTIGETNFMYDAGLTVISGNDNVSLRNIEPAKDVLEVRGLGEKIFSLSVTRGHGVLEFADYDDFLGGSIEIGYDVFDDIAENMKYVLKEGQYKVILKKDNLTVNKVVDIKRDQTEVLRLSGYTAEMTKTSKVAFSLSPSSASISIDGKEVDVSKTIELNYGEYLVKVKADGYVGWESVVTISKPKTVMSIALAMKKEKAEEEKKDDGMAEPSTDVEKTDNDSEETGISETPTEDDEDKEIKVRTDSTKNIFFRKPVGATISFDGRVIGDAPCEMTKVTGEHEITLKMDGYETQTYTINIEDDGEDAVFSFPDMIREKQ